MGVQDLNNMKRRRNPLQALPKSLEDHFGSGHAEWLWRFWITVHKNSRVVADFLFPTHPRGYVKVTKMLGNFASNSAVAMKERLAGRINAAMIYENIADSIYERLPSYAKETADGLTVYDEGMFTDLPIRSNPSRHRTRSNPTLSDELATYHRYRVRAFHDVVQTPNGWSVRSDSSRRVIKIDTEGDHASILRTLVKKKILKPSASTSNVAVIEVLD
jgi:hypothetical protein